ncbi:MAG: hypothetical protein WAO12_04770 [Venatoribacter sp.]
MDRRSFIAKQVRELKFDYHAPNSYYVTVSTRNGECIFGQIAQGATKVELTELGQVVAQKINDVSAVFLNLHVDAYIVMPNHAHLLVTSLGGEPTVSELVKRFKTEAVKEVGYSFWKRSFTNHVVRNPYDYSRILNLIGSNPEQWQDDPLHPNYQVKRYQPTLVP